MNTYGAIALASLAAVLTDWLFVGRLFKDRHRTSPEAWRAIDRSWARLGIVALFAIVTAGGFVLLAEAIEVTYPTGSIKLALMIWLIAPMPLVVLNGLFLRIEPLVSIVHAAGWLVKLLLIAAITEWAL